MSMDNLRHVDLVEDGLLWLINKEVFHSRGYRLGVVPVGDPVFGVGQPVTFVILGDGSRPVRFGDDIDEQDLFDRVKGVLS